MDRPYFIGALFVLLAHCSSTTPNSAVEQPSGVSHAVLAPNAKVLDPAGLAALTSAAADGTLVFSATSLVLDTVKQGDVLIIGTSGPLPSGAIRKGVSVAQPQPPLTLETRPADIQDAFEELRVTYTTTLSPSSTTPTGPAPQADDQQNDGITLPFSLDESDAHGSIGLDGSLFLSPRFGLDIDIDITQFKLKELSAKFTADETLVVAASAQGQASIDKSVVLGQIPFTPITLTVPTPAGPLPVVLTPGVRLEAGAQGSIDGQVETSVTQQAGFTAGLGYQNGSFGGFSDSTSSFNFEQPTYQGAANLKLYAGPRLEVLLYGAVGPFATVDAYVEMSATAGGPPPCASGLLDAGLSAKAGVDLIANYETTLFNKNHPLASFDSCTNDPNAPRPAATWARSFGRSGSSGERARAVTQLSDGTYVVVGDSNLFAGIDGFAASLWAMRLDALGNVMWQRAFGRLGAFGQAQGVVAVPDGVLVSASTGLMKLDSGGNLVWANAYDNGSALELASMAVGGDGRVVVAGTFGVDTRAWAMKLDAQGRLQWSRSYGGKDFVRVRATSDGGYVLVGRSDDNASDALLVKLDGDGNVQWKTALDDRYDNSADKTAGSTPVSAIDRGYDVVEKPGGGYVVVGESYGSFPLPEPGQPGFYAAWVAEVDAQGQLSTSALVRCPSDALYGDAYAAAVWPNGSTLVVGRRAGESSDLLSHEDVLMLRGGACSVLGGGGNDSVYPGLTSGGTMPLLLTQDGGAILAATSDSFSGAEQFWVVKLDGTGGIRFPYSQNLSGSSWTNSDAISASLSSDFQDAAVSTTGITSAMTSEVTDYVKAGQTP